MTTTFRMMDVYRFAEEAHRGQTRKYTGEPYINHPVIVAQNVKNVGASREAVAAAILHDVVEDTPVTLDEIRTRFGDRVAELVEMVTDVSRPEDGNRRIRKEIDRQHLAQADAEGQTIKLADLIDNSYSIVARDENFAKVYMREKKELLKILTKGDRTLYDRATQIVKDYYGE